MSVLSVNETKVALINKFGPNGNPTLTDIAVLINGISLTRADDTTDISLYGFTTGTDLVGQLIDPTDTYGEGGVSVIISTNGIEVRYGPNTVIWGFTLAGGVSLQFIKTF